MAWSARADTCIHFAFKFDFSFKFGASLDHSKSSPMDNKPPYKGRGHHHVAFINVGAAVLSQELLKQSSRAS